MKKILTWLRGVQNITFNMFICLYKYNIFRIQLDHLNFWKIKKKKVREKNTFLYVCILYVYKLKILSLLIIKKYFKLN
jgi:hypothetical protein